jgi:tripartite-type tricarboxylate transporter receptor subunit TctC
MVLGSSPGSITDLIARVVQPGLATRLGQPVIVDNRPGAGGNIAAGFLRQASPDGNTIMVVSGGIMTLNPYLYRDLPFDPVRHFRLISRITAGGFLLAVSSASGITDVAGLLERLREKGGAANFGSPGIGFVPHLAGELLLKTAGLQATHIPYRGSAAATNGLIAGEVDFLFDSRGPLLPHLESGAIRLIANAGTDPDHVFPDLPVLSTILPGVVIRSWTAVIAPAGLSDAIARKLDEATRATLQDPEVITRLRSIGNGPAYLSGPAFGAFYTQERERAAAMIAAAGVQPQ